MKKESPGSSNVTSGYNSDMENQVEVIEEKKIVSNSTKKNENSYSIHKGALSFFIDGGGVASVIAIVRPKPIKYEDKKDSSEKRILLGSADKEKKPMHLEGKLLIYETKNVDMIKKISWKALVCSNQEEYMRLVLSEPQLFREYRSDLRETNEETNEEEEEEEERIGKESELRTPPNTPCTNSPVDALFLQAYDKQDTQKYRTSFPTPPLSPTREEPEEVNFRYPSFITWNYSYIAWN